MPLSIISKPNRNTTYSSANMPTKNVSNNWAFYTHFFSPNHSGHYHKQELHSTQQQQQLMAAMQQLIQRYAIFFRSPTIDTATALEQIYQHIVVWISSKHALQPQTVAFALRLSAVYETLRQQDTIALANLLCEWHKANIAQLTQYKLTVTDTFVLPYLESIATTNPKSANTVSLNDLLPWLDTLVLLCRYDMESIDCLLGQVYENYVKNFLKDKQYAQVFTPPPLATLMSQYLEPYLHSGAKVLDPACGAGALLLAIGATGQQRNEPYAITGFDVSNFALWLCSMSWLLQQHKSAIVDLPFHVVNDSIYHFLTQDSLAQQFDVVIANPPYLGYNACCQQKMAFFEAMKNKKFTLNNIFGINLHSPPQHAKKYAPKPNLYAFFIALGIYSLRDNGILCYLIPQTLLTATDTDTIRYYLAKELLIEKIVTFSEKVFVGRGNKQTSNVITSSMIVLVRRTQAPAQHAVLCQQLEVGSWKIIEEKQVSQQLLYNNYSNWNFVTQTAFMLQLQEQYVANSESLAQYYDHKLAKQQWGSNFYFDPGYMVDYQKADKTTGKYVIPRLGSTCWLGETYGYWHDFSDDPHSPHYIRLRQSNQGYELLHTHHKIVWSYSNPQRFHYIAGNKVLIRFQEMAIGSDNETEILYLLGILNATITRHILSFYLKNEHEKDFLVGLKAIKQYVRVPILHNEAQQMAKQRLIALVQQCLAAEQQGNTPNAAALWRSIDVLVESMYGF